MNGGGIDPSATDMSVEQIRDLLGDVPGVASLEIDLRDESSPRLRLHLDGTEAISTVRAEVHRLLRSGLRTRSSPLLDRRVLGRALVEALADVEQATPAQLDEVRSQHEPPVGLALVAVEETLGGVSVRAADSAGGVAFSPVEDPKSLNQAIVSAVARLRQQRPLPRLSGVEIRDVEGSPVLTVVLRLEGGARRVGSSLVEGGMPFTLGRAVWKALASDR